MTTRSLGAAVLSALILVPVAPAFGGDWPSFRGPGARGVADGENLPVSWDVASGQNVRWKVAIPGVGHSSPVIWKDRIFATSAVGPDDPELLLGKRGGSDIAGDMTPHSWRIFCVDAKSGAILWEKEVYSGVPRAERHGKGSYANATPATDGKTVVAIFGSQGMAAFDLDGELKWKTDLGVLDGGLHRDVTSSWGHGSSPVIADGRVFVQIDRHSDSFLAAFEVETGERLWTVARNEWPVWATPTLLEAGSRTELIVQGGRYVRAYDPATGKELWRLEDDAKVKIPTPFVSDGLIVLAGGFRGRPMFGVRPGGSGDLTLAEGTNSSEFVAWHSEKGGPYTCTPVAYDGLLYVLRDAGILQVHDLKTGEQIHAERTGATHSASPVASDGHLYVTSEEGEILVYRAGREPELLARNAMGEPALATPAIAQKTLFVRTAGHLFAIGEKK
jgi:outer membrane protein assembly factor BamB